MDRYGSRRVEAGFLPDLACNKKAALARGIIPEREYYFNRKPGMITYKECW
jgi:hypothetical protein